MERTLVLLKPDAVRRRLVGRIIARFEDGGLDIPRIETVAATAEQVRSHYPDDEEYLRGMGEKTVRAYGEAGRDCAAAFGTNDPVGVAQRIREMLVEYLTSGPMVKMLVCGPEAVSTVRRLVGATLPTDADPDSIRGEFCNDSALAAGEEGRAVMNLVHASGTPAEAETEIALWFPDL